MFINKKERIYLDYAASTPLDARVKKAMDQFWSRDFGNPSSPHKEGQLSSRAVFMARNSIARQLELPLASGYKNIIFTGSATEANNLILRGVVKSWRAVSDTPPHLVVSSVEHESILETAKDLKSEGVEITYLPVSKEGLVDLDALKHSLNERTVLVSVMYANNEVGTIQPIKEITRIIADFKVATNRRDYPLFHTDAVQAFQYLDCYPDVLGVDAMTLSAQKIYGPKGIGLLYTRSGVQPTSPKLLASLRGRSGPATNYKLQAITTGGGQEFGIRSGTENVPLIVGFEKALEIASSVRKEEAKRLHTLSRYFLKRLRQVGIDFLLNGGEKKRLPNNVNIYFRSPKAVDLITKFDLSGLAVSQGSACATRLSNPSYVLRAMGFDEKRAKESVRFTLGRYTTRNDIDKTVKIIVKLLHS